MSVFPDEFREETKECLEKWRNIIINKHETEENFYGDPILIIEYNDAGLTARNIDSHAVAQGISLNIKLFISLRVYLIPFY
jgi:hypothetical protein